MDEATKNGITSSEIFMVVWSKNYADNIPWDQVNLAKELGKPFRVLVDKGISVPEEFRQGVTNYKEKSVNLDISKMDITGLKEWINSNEL